jgi:hypothetical protein
MFNNEIDFTSCFVLTAKLAKYSFYNALKWSLNKLAKLLAISNTYFVQRLNLWFGMKSVCVSLYIITMNFKFNFKKRSAHAGRYKSNTVTQYIMNE